jgi:hypothetical protein
MNRRGLVLGGVAGLALVGVGGAAWRVTRMPNVTGPWRFDPAPLADVRLDAFRHAILAPNPHNRQPWQIRLVGADEAIVTCDLNRRLPQTDPFDRQIVIGFGAFLELMDITARERGWRTDITPFPGGEPQPRLDGRPIAHIKFVQDPGIAKDPLFATILKRRSTKEPYDMARSVPPEMLATLAAAAMPGNRIGGTGSADTQALRRLIWDGLVLETSTPRTMKESADLLRVGTDEIERNPDGIALSGPLFEGLNLVLGADAVRAQAMDPNSEGSKGQMARYKETFDSTPAFLWLISEGNARADQIMAGRAWLRANLLANSLGLSVAPVSQVLQEFAEMTSLHERSRALVGAAPTETVQMLSRLGYGPDVPPAERWPLDAKLVRT